VNAWHIEIVILIHQTLKMAWGGVLSAHSNAAALEYLFFLPAANTHFLPSKFINCIFYHDISLMPTTRHFVILESAIPDVVADVLDSCIC